jgi:phosphoglycolate phosphatase
VPARKLVLWDIDGTLVSAGEGGRALYAAAFERFAGVPLVVRTTMAGRTDPDILRDTLAAHGVPAAAGSFERFSSLLAAAYEERPDLLRASGRSLPGAARALAALGAASAAVQSVVTGNIRPVARAKLAAFDLAAHLDLEAGGYGSDDALRANLVRLARRRAACRHGPAFAGVDTVVVGDTPDDVRAALAAGARAVAVATGQATAEELAAAGAALVLPDLADTAAVLRALLET